LRHSLPCLRSKLQILLILQLQQEFFSSGGVGVVGGGVVSGGVVSVSMIGVGVIGGGVGGAGGGGSSNALSEPAKETSLSLSS
jgi:hypothetical protein